MAKALRVALVGDYNPSVTAHQAIPVALQLAAAEVPGTALTAHWIHTSTISNASRALQDFDGVWCVPASPYANMEGALAAIRFAREHNVPFLGSCGGFQHAIIEYARNVCALPDADHAETNPESPNAIISYLACTLVEESETLVLATTGRVRDAYGAAQITEAYHCRFGLNPSFKQRLFDGSLQVSARGSNGEVRAVELAGHPFYVATLFQSERRALRGEVPPLVRAFVAAIADRAGSTLTTSASSSTNVSLSN